ncbi:MAG: hypothetical protein HQL52_05115 [Magnetococcales bacterium]|nr:hypothetical protein [Magnetococcales bacterium]
MKKKKLKKKIIKRITRETKRIQGDLMGQLRFLDQRNTEQLQTLQGKNQQALDEMKSKLDQFQHSLKEGQDRQAALGELLAQWGKSHTKSNS